MRPVNTLRLAGKALALAVLLFSYSTSKAATLASTIDNPDGSHALQPGHQEVVQGTVQGAAPPARLYRTHDNGNYHRFHSDSSQLHSQPDNNRLEARKHNRHGSRKIRHRYAGGSELQFRRYHHFPQDRHFGNHYYGRSDHRFFNTLVGGAILYRLFR